MAEIQHLRRAPIVEALIDIRVEARSEFRGESFQNIVADLADSFPHVEERRGVTLQLAFGGPQPQQELQEHGLSGLFFRSRDEKAVAQFRTDGFTYNRLEPYTSWAEILPQALDLLNRYLTIAAPRAVTRTATRYINRLRLPSPFLDEYLAQSPRGVPGTNHAINQSMEVTLGLMDTGEMVSFTQALEAAAVEAEARTVIIDIDAYWPEPIEATVSAVEPHLVRLHDLKNQVFFAALTDSALRLFQ